MKSTKYITTVISCLIAGCIFADFEELPKFEKIPKDNPQNCSTQNRPPKPPKGPDFMIGKLLKDPDFVKSLKITDETLQKIDEETTVLETSIKALEEKTGTLAKKQLEQMTALMNSNDAADEQPIMDCITEIGQCRIAVAQAKMRKMLVLTKYLNKEQRNAIHQRLEEHKNKMMRHREMFKNQVRKDMKDPQGRQNGQFKAKTKNRWNVTTPRTNNDFHPKVIQHK